ncbi:MAG: outer membrane beta-barrel protein [Anaeromyxobacteraceae bacterium]
MKKLALAIALVASLAPAAARAQYAASLRLGYAVGVQDYAKDIKMRDTLNSQVPIQLDLGFKVLPKVTLGAYVSYGFAHVGSACPVDASCSGNVTDFGLQLQYRFATRPVSPWASVGVGWEKTSFEVEKAKTKAEGLDLLRLAAGWEWPVNDTFGVGPFVQYQLGRYESYTIPGTTSDPGKTIHGWFTIGFRGTFDDLADWDAAARAAAEKAAAEKAAAEKAAADKLAAQKAAAEKAAAEAKAAADAAAAKAAAEAAAAKAAAEAAKPDRDGDGIPDDSDACPDQKGERSSDPKKNGCKQLIVVTEKGFDLKEKIQFNTGKATINPVSEPS